MLLTERSEQVRSVKEADWFINSQFTPLDATCSTSLRGGQLWAAAKSRSIRVVSALTES